MFHIECDSSHLTDKLDALIRNMDGMTDSMEQTLISWQRDDLNRQRPVADREGPNMVATSILQHIRSDIVRSAMSRRRGRPPGSRNRMTSIIRPSPPPRSTMPRPNLRVEKFELLAIRMREMLEREMRWP